MIEGQGDSEAGEVDKEGEGLHDSRRKSWKKERLGIRNAGIVREIREQERETDVTLTNG